MESVQNESAVWLASISKDKRAVIRQLHDLTLRWNLVGLFFPLLWAATAVVMVLLPIWPVRLIGYAIIGASIHAMGIVMHEGIHGTFFRHRFLDRFFGFLLGLPTLFSVTAYKVAHLNHHRHNRTEKDQDEFTNHTKSPLFHTILFYIWSVLGTLIYMFVIPVTALKIGKPRERVAIVLEYIILALIYSIILMFAFRAGHLDLVLHLWIVPIGFTMLIGNIRGWAEHAMTRIGHPLTQTRTVTSNRLVSFMMCNLNYHLEHHLCPGIPWYNLPKLHTLLQDDYREAGSFIYTSYLRFIWDAVRTGVHGVTKTTVLAEAPGIPGRTYSSARRGQS